MILQTLNTQHLEAEHAEPEIDINQNTRAFSENPLHRYTPEKLEVAVKNFVAEHGLQDI